MKKLRNYKDYLHYLNHQKVKTLDPQRRKKWLNQEWQLKINGFKNIFERYKAILKPNMRALCIGARTGQEVVALRDLGVEAIGIDIVPCEPYVVQADMHELPFEGESFDFVFSNVFDHSLYPGKKCSEIERVLKIDGYALLQLQIDTGSDEFTEVEIHDVYLDVLPLFNNSFCLVNQQVPTNSVFATMNWEILMKKDKEAVLFNRAVGDISDISVPDKYKKIWDDINLPVQIQKATQYNMKGAELVECFNKLSKRAYYLVSIAQYINAKNIVEVGTAQGWQFYSFAQYVTENSGHVWSCDIRDVRSEDCYSEKYKDVTNFCLGTSLELAKVLQDCNQIIDLFYIDGSHDSGDVLRDVTNLYGVQSKNPVWIFDDFDERFGIFYDIKKLCEINKKFKIYYVGNTASGNPNHQVIFWGRF